MTAISHRLPEAAKEAVPDPDEDRPADLLSREDLSELLRAISRLMEPALDPAAVRLFAETLTARRGKGWRERRVNAHDLLVAATKAGPHHQ